MKNKAKLILISLAIVLVTVPISAFPGDKILEELDLTADQKTQIQAFHKNQQQQMQDVFAQLKSKHEELEKVLAQPQIEEKALTTVVGEIKALNGQMVEGHLNGIIAIRRILGEKAFKEFTIQMRIDRKKSERKRGRIGKRDDDFPPPPPPPGF